MADFFTAFESLMNDVFGREYAGGKLYPLPLEVLGYQAGIWKLELIQSGCGEAAFDSRFREFYHVGIWMRLRAEELFSQAIADSLFRYASYSSCSHAIRLMQATLGMPSTEMMSDDNIHYLNLMDEDSFYLSFGRGKVAMMLPELRRKLFRKS